MHAINEQFNDSSMHMSIFMSLNVKTQSSGVITDSGEVC